MIPTRQKKRPTDLELHNRFAPLCRFWYRGRDAEVKRLAETIGVAPWALDALKVGWDGSAWTFPEQNHAGLIVGVNRRLQDGSKICVTGSHRGLTYSEGHLMPGPLLIVEGGSDVAAGLTMGLSVVGRPSNTGGIDYLAKLLEDYQEWMMIIAERDRKDHADLPDVIRKQHDPNCPGCQSCFPGKWGAIKTSIQLSRKLNRIVAWRFLPDNQKDLRGWLNQKPVNLDNQIAMQRLRNSLIRRSASEKQKQA